VSSADEVLVGPGTPAFELPGIRGLVRATRDLKFSRRPDGGFDVEALEILPSPLEALERGWLIEHRVESLPAFDNANAGPPNQSEL
jgi:hypothetical protein